MIMIMGLHFSPTQVAYQIAALRLHRGVAASEDPCQLLGREDCTVGDDSFPQIDDR